MAAFVNKYIEMTVNSLIMIHLYFWIDTFEDDLRKFLDEGSIKVNDFGNLFQYFKTVLGVFSMDDMVELSLENLEDERAG